MATAATATEIVTAIEMATVTAMTPTLTPSALPLNAQQVVQKIPRHKSGRVFLSDRPKWRVDKSGYE